jgi:hypothetical protein
MLTVESSESPVGADGTEAEFTLNLFDPDDPAWMAEKRCVALRRGSWLWPRKRTRGRHRVPGKGFQLLMLPVLVAVLTVIAAGALGAFGYSGALLAEHLMSHSRVPLPALFRVAPVMVVVLAGAAAWVVIAKTMRAARLQAEPAVS